MVLGQVPVFGARAADFERDLRRLRRTSSTGRFAERTRDIALDIWRPVEDPSIDRETT